MSKYNPKQVSISKGNGKVDVIGIASSEDMERALNDKLDVDGDATNTTVDFTSASTRTNISTGETQSTLFGKIKKWFSDLKTVAFTGKYSDLTDTPTNATASTSGFMSSTDKAKLDGIAEGAQVNSVTGVKGDIETAYRTGNVNITKSNVGLGNVPNVTTNNQTPTYTEATTLATLSSGEYLSSAFGKIKKAITEFINHKNSTSNPHSVTKSQVGLDNCDNTSDADKPISTATQAALNGKSPTSHRSTTTVYGKGDESYYGHVKLSDSVSTIGGASAGIAATPSAVKIAYDKAVEAYNLADGIDVTNSATYVVTTQSELNSAMSSLPEKGGKIILREGSFIIPNITIPNNARSIVFQGMGKGVTYIDSTHGFTSTGTITFRDMTVRMLNNITRGSSSSKASLIFENCNVSDFAGDGEIYNGTGDLTFINCNTDLRGLTVNSDCISGIASAGKVCFIGGRVNLNSGSTYQSGFDCNLIYDCTEYSFIGTRIICSGINRINIVYGGTGNFNGGSIYLGSDKHSISHYDSDTSVGGSFTGVYVEYYATYMKFAAISGCTFNHKAAGSSSANQMILQCPTDMTGNHFKGSAAYINGQSLKHIIDRNMSDNGITVGSTASGSITTNNVTY